MEYTYGIEPVMGVVDLHETILKPDPIVLALDELEPFYPGVKKDALRPQKTDLPWGKKNDLSYKALIKHKVSVEELHYAIGNVFDKVEYIEPVKEVIESMDRLKTMFVTTGGEEFATSVLKAFFLDGITKANIVPITTKLVEDCSGVLKKGPFYMCDEGVRELFVALSKPLGPTIFIGDRDQVNYKAARAANAAIILDERIKGYRRETETIWRGDHSYAPEMLDDIRKKTPYHVGMAAYGEQMHGQESGKMSSRAMSSFFNFTEDYKIISEQLVPEVVA